MLLDERLEFADNVSVAAGAGTSLVGDVVDTGGDGAEGNSEDLFLVIQTGDTEIITGGTAGTLELQLVSDSTADLATSPTVHYTTGALVTDDSALNDARFNVGETIVAVQLPRGVYERYLGVRKIIGTTTITAGTVNAFLTKTPTALRAFPDALPAVA
jgi:hypothetical protein